MKFGIVLTLLLIGFSFSVYAQELRLRGSIKSDNQIPLTGATVQIDRTTGTTTDERGLFDFRTNTSDDEVLLEIRMLGYQDLDTLVQINRKGTFLEIILKEVTYSLPAVEIPSRKFNLFDNNKWNLLSHAILANKHYVLGHQTNRRSLFIFSETGELLEQLELKEKYNHIHLSCQQKLHLIGDEAYGEISFKYGTINISPYGGDLYQNLIKKCVLINDGEFIFKDLANHNKNAKYYFYPEPKKPKLVKEITDNKAKRASESYYREIIGRYYNTVETPDSTGIAYGIPQDNIIARNEWSGDLKELIVTNELQTLVSYYLNVVSQEIKLYEFSINDTILIFDLNNNILHAVHTDKSKAKKTPLDKSVFGRKGQIVKDATTNELYLISKNNQVYKISVHESKVTLKLTCELISDDLIHKEVNINNRSLYYITKETGRPVSRMNRIALQ